MDRTIYLSPSKLNLLNECPRCFWLAEKMGISRPRGIFPSLPGGMDLVLKNYFDNYRGSLPPELMGRVPGVLMPDMNLLKKWRNWKTGLQVQIGEVILRGALDDCLLDEAIYYPFDNKTKGQVPKDDGRQYYELQLDCYELMLRHNGYKTGGKGYLNYLYPLNVEEITERENRVIIPFVAVPFEIPTSPDRAIEKMSQAATIIKSNVVPEANPECEQCDYFTKRQIENDKRRAII